MNRETVRAEIQECIDSLGSAGSLVTEDLGEEGVWYIAVLQRGYPVHSWYVTESDYRYLQNRVASSDSSEYRARVERDFAALGI